MRFEDLATTIVGLQMEQSVQGTLESATLSAIETGYDYVDPFHVLMMLSRVSPSVTLRRSLQKAVFYVFDDASADVVNEDTIYDALAQIARDEPMLHESRVSVPTTQMLGRMKWLAHRRSEKAPMSRGDLVIAVFTTGSPIVRALLEKYELSRMDILRVLGAPDAAVLEFAEVDVPTP